MSFSGRMKNDAYDSSLEKWCFLQGFYVFGRGPIGKMGEIIDLVLESFCYDGQISLEPSSSLRGDLTVDLANHLTLLRMSCGQISSLWYVN